MSTFDEENKVRFEELAPSLQQRLTKLRQDLDSHTGDNQRHLNGGERDKWNKAAEDAWKASETISNQLGDIRITISDTPPANPVNNNEIWVDKSTTNSHENIPAFYKDGWLLANSASTLNIPTFDAGGNIWIA